MASNTEKDASLLIQLYQIYDQHRDALLWFLHKLAVTDYDDYKKKYPGTSKERNYFTTVCGFFELSGVIVNRGMLDESLYFDLFNVTPFWEKAKQIVSGMRKDRPHIYENFELLYNKRKIWAKKRRTKI